VAAPRPLSAPQKALAAAAQVVGRRDDDLVLYNSFSGRFSDNPRGIYDALVRRDPSRQHVWLSSDDTAFPSDLRTVDVYSPRYAHAMGRAGVVVSNAQLPYYLHRNGATYLQTWHGTPLKRLGLDNPRRRDSADGFKRAVRDYGEWDLLLSQNPHSTACFRSAFAFDGEVLEVGYPRNDVLRSADAPVLRAAVRAQLGIADGVQAVLYAPTWRDDTVNDAALSLPLDLARVQQALGPDVVVLLRLHHWVAAGITETHGAIDVSSHPDIRDLYLAADALVTDYSSCMFDFAVTGKPIVLFVPDLEHYSETLRGFYFDIVEQTPGPLCRDSDGLIAVLGDLEGTRTPDAYRAFAERYVPWDDGGSGDRVVDRLLR
jgi:CDP-glycerol glycerophosphotransferase